jgi:hypothetical protein
MRQGKRSVQDEILIGTLAVLATGYMFVRIPGHRSLCKNQPHEMHAQSTPHSPP